MVPRRVERIEVRRVSILLIIICVLRMCHPALLSISLFVIGRDGRNCRDWRNLDDVASGKVNTEVEELHRETKDKQATLVVTTSYCTRDSSTSIAGSKAEAGIMLLP